MKQTDMLTRFCQSRRFRRILSLLTVTAAGLIVAFPKSAAGSAWTGVASLPSENTEGPLWLPVAEDTLAPVPAELITRKYRVVRLGHRKLQDLLARAPLEAGNEVRSAEVVMELPWPDGSFRRFLIEESPIMEPDLAAQLLEIKTYRGQGIDEPTAGVRFDWSPSGFHAMVLSADGDVFIDPYSRGDTENYIVYYVRDGRREGGEPFQCGTVGEEVVGTAQGYVGAPLQPPHGATRRTYRIAVGATGEYTAFHGGTVGGALNGIVTTINRVNAIFERDLAVRLTLVNNNTAVVYTDPSTDPYTNGDTLAMQCENPHVLDTNIGVNNYDVGHVFATAGGGRAQVAVVCSAASNCALPGSDKARGASGSASPTGDSHDVGLVAHEIGHQFGAQHSFNGTTGSCAPALGGRNAPTAFEPGGGSTIMAYAGACGSESLQLTKDPYFHAVSQDQMIGFINGTGGARGAQNDTGNTPPTVGAGPDYTIPQSTPFTLTATSSDANGDFLNYAWEEMDLGRLPHLNPAEHCGDLAGRVQPDGDLESR